MISHLLFSSHIIALIYDGADGASSHACVARAASSTRFARACSSLSAFPRAWRACTAIAHEERWRGLRRRNGPADGFCMHDDAILLENDARQVLCSQLRAAIYDKLLDTKRQAYYYFNNITGEASWCKPKFMGTDDFDLQENYDFYQSEQYMFSLKINKWKASNPKHTRTMCTTTTTMRWTTTTTKSTRWTMQK